MSHKYATITVKRKQCNRRIDERRLSGFTAGDASQDDTILVAPGLRQLRFFLFSCPALGRPVFSSDLDYRPKITSTACTQTSHRPFVIGLSP